MAGGVRVWRLTRCDARECHVLTKLGVLCSAVQCTVPILVKCGGNYKQYYPSW
jgi:hypothetical protein